MYLNLKQFVDIIKTEISLFDRLPLLLLEIQRRIAVYEEDQEIFKFILENSPVLLPEQKELIGENLELLVQIATELRQVLDVWNKVEKELLGANEFTMLMLERMLSNELLTKRPEYNQTWQELYGEVAASGLQKLIFDLHDFFGGFFNNKVASFILALDMIIFDLLVPTNPSRPQKERDVMLDNMNRNLKKTHQEMITICAELRKLNMIIHRKIVDLA
jgi:hypothetical protein